MTTEKEDPRTETCGITKPQAIESHYDEVLSVELTFTKLDLWSSSFHIRIPVSKGG